MFLIFLTMPCGQSPQILSFEGQANIKLFCCYITFSLYLELLFKVGLLLLSCILHTIYLFYFICNLKKNQQLPLHKKIEKKNTYGHG